MWRVIALLAVLALTGCSDPTDPCDGAVMDTGPTSDSVRVRICLFVYEDPSP